MINQTIETQRSLARQGLELTRQGTKSAVGIVPDNEQRTRDRVDDVFDDIESTQDDVLDNVQDLAVRGVNGSEDLANSYFGVLGASFDAQESTTEQLEQATEETIDKVENAAEETLETTEETVEEVGETAEDTVDTAEDETEDMADDVEDMADDVEDEVDDVVSDPDETLDLEDAIGTSPDATRADVEDFRAELTGEFDDIEDRDIGSFVEEEIETLSDLTEAATENVASALGVDDERADEVIDHAVDQEATAIEDIEGIGQTYSDRLAAADVRTASQLSRTSIEDVSEIAQVNEERASDWINQAQEEA